jgi:putative transposase
MPRRQRFATGGYVYHVLNRGVARAAIFEKDDDYRAFLNVLREAAAEYPMRLLAYCLMPNHWHLVLWPEQDGELSVYLHWLTTTHMQRWHGHHHTRGTGPLYQGRFKSFPVEEDEHLWTVCRYAERNAQRAGLVTQAELWRWGSLSQRLHGWTGPPLSVWPFAIPPGWVDIVNAPQTESELSALRRCVIRGAPYGNPDWQQRTAERLGLQSTLRARGRPLKMAKL